MIRAFWHPDDDQPGWGWVRKYEYSNGSRELIDETYTRFQLPPKDDGGGSAEPDPLPSDSPQRELAAVTA